MILALAAPPLLPVEIAFWNARRGVAIVAAANSVLRGSVWLATTTDGGRSWRIGRRADGAIAIDVAGVRDAWAGGSSGLLHSADGGRSWRRVSTIRATAVSFSTPRIGLVGRVPFTSAIGTTRDGGLTWRRRPNPCPRPLSVSFVSLGTSRDGWILCTGEPGAGNQAKLVLQTVDGGRTWRRASGGLAMTPGYGVGIDFRGPLSGWLWESRGGFFATRDAGRTWHALRIGVPEQVEAASASLFSPRGGVALLHDVRRRPLRLELARTLDAGRTWTTIRSWPVTFWPR